jgi:regulatory protein
LLKLLTRRDHSRSELARKLSAKGYDPFIAEQAIEHATQKGWLNENRFIEAYAQMRKRRGYGPLRIQAELRERGIAAAFLLDIFADKNGSEYLAQVFQKKFGCTKLSDDFGLRAKQIRFLQYRGFSLEEIMDTLE